MLSCRAEQGSAPMGGRNVPFDSIPWSGKYNAAWPQLLNARKPMNARFLPIFAALVAATLTAPGTPGYTQVSR